jgi:hypothetical protein
MRNAKKIFNLLVVTFLLVGLPGVSYYYLSTGYTYRKEAIKTQGDFGKMPDLSNLTAVRGKLPASSRGAMTVVAWYDPTKPAAAVQYGEMMDSLYQQFEKSPNLYFTTIVRADDPVVSATQFADTYNLPEAKMLNFLAADAGQFAQSARDFNLPTNLTGEDPIVALVDSSLTIVKHYNLAERNQTIGLVNLISLIIPLPERPDLILKRDNEL